jgi:hypothetical protein
MYFLLFIVLLLAMVVYALFDKRATIAFALDTNRNDMHLLFYWLYPLMMARMEMLHYSPHLTIYLLKTPVYTKTLKSKKNRKTNLFDTAQALQLTEGYAKAYYGLDNPFHTAVTSGAIDLFRSFFPNIPIEQIPDFMPGHEYVVIQAGVKLNIGKTLFRMIRQKSQNKIRKRSGSYGSVQYN